MRLYPLPFTIILSIIVLWLSLPVSNSQAQNRPRKTAETVIANKAMVVSASKIASDVGIAVIKNGGNAIDAAIAVEFALAVVFPEAGNLGGGGFMVIRKANGEVYALDYREKAPAAATPTMFLDAEGNVMPQKSIEGHLSVGVPGTVDGMVSAHKRFGTLPWAQLLQPAIDLATKGYPLTLETARALNLYRDEFMRLNVEQPVYVRTRPWQQGHPLVQPDLARTLEKIRDNGRDGFYAGTVAESIENEMKRGGGLITQEDLKSYKATWRTPVSGSWKGYQIISMCPPSSGGIALIQLLKMSENQPLRTWGHNTTKTAHFMAEAEKRVFADRAAYLADPDFVTVPVEKLLNTDYIKTRMDDFNPEKATSASHVHSGTLPESMETTHYSIVDAEGNAVAATTTLNGTFGSKVVVKGAGFFLNNQMDDFSAKPGTPNSAGLVYGKANGIAPGKRMLSSMSPTIVTKDGKLVMVLGGVGGPTIITAVYQTILNVLEHGMTLTEGLNARRFHCQWRPDQITAEEGCFDERTLEELRFKGHTVKVVPRLSQVNGIRVMPDGKLEGAPEPRQEGGASGY